MMAIQDFQPIHKGEARTVHVFDLPPVERKRMWGLQWLGPVRYRQQLCWRDEDGDTCFVSPEFLTNVCGKLGTKYLQRDGVWEGIPCLKGKKQKSDLEQKKEEMRARAQQRKQGKLP